MSKRKFTKEYVDKILNDPEEIKRRTKYAYWVSDGKGWGYEKLVSSPEEVPKGLPYHKCICMG